MALSTYAELKTSVADWLNRSDLTAAIADFISLAEAQIERVLRTRNMLVRGTGNITAEYTALPADFLDGLTLKLTGTNPITPLQSETLNSLDTLQNTTYLSSGKPLFFAIVGENFRVLPTPDSTYAYELVYYADLAKLSVSNTTNWLLTQAPDIYLYGALLQAAPYLQNDERIPVWVALYTKGIDDLRLADDRSTQTGTMLARARTLG
jgi:hypothetical protein